MKTIVTYLIVLLLTFFAHQALAQEDGDTSYEIQRLEGKKEEVVQNEREALKIEVEEINGRLRNKEITKEEAGRLKKAAAEKRAKNIENKLAIIENSIQLLKRTGTTDLNLDTNSIEVAIGGKDEGGDVLFGVKYNSGNQKKVVFDKRTYSYPVVAIGLNNALFEGGSLDDSPYKVGGSRFFELGWVWRTRVFENSNFLRLAYGASLQFNGLKPEDNQYFVMQDGEARLQEFETDLKKSKFRMDNLVFPVHFEIGPSNFSSSDEKIRYDIHNKFRVGLGGYAGFNLGTRQKLKYEVDGETVKDKLKRSYNTSNFIYGLSGYLGFDGVLLYAKYDLNPIFKDASVDQHNISLGLRFDLD
ncbi:hypothetical protein [Pseudozobellia thermophila]|uniref:Outer membrane protein beta-barrel domain-containing protein n=1 Tax=Pseudozobellia thermophila TaxID=192903 RepID=A0A1M6JKB5_9FLAO|nr:hypothetical protein [Pseudozobellia thermophila]SHJ47127.1 hypothetical protein SAMN04488513_10560 [Pseudozobellia thermophila]